MRASSLSLVLGIVAIASLPLSLTFGVWDLSAFPVVAGIAALGIVCGLVGLRRPGRRPMAVAGILCSIVGPLHWMAAWPRGHASPEGAALGDIRNVIASQNAYASMNAGFYDRLECLSHPRACLPGYPEMAPTFLDSMLASGKPKSGYERHFIAGPRAAGGLSTSSLSSYAYVAVPTEPGKSGVRGFCGDSEGMVCATRDGSRPLVREGRCAVVDGGGNASDCVLLR